MMSVMMGLFAGVALQPNVERPPAPPAIIFTPAPRPPAPPPPPFAPVTQGTRARSITPLPSLFSTDDYPAVALRNGETGTVTFDAAIDRDGRVTGCAITTSSGSASLDATTCSIIQRRARFTPARDANGRAVADRSIARIRWMLPPPGPLPFANERVALVLTGDDAGTLVKCRVEANVAKPKEDQLCPAMMAMAGRISAEARQHVSLAGRELVLEQGLLIGGPEVARGIGLGAGQTLGMMVAVALDIDAGGAIVGCAPAEGNRSEERATARCTEVTKATVVALDPAAGDRSERHAVRYWANYTRPID